MSSRFGTYVQHSEPVVCICCDAEGKIAWERGEGVADAGKELVGIKGNFYERIAKKAPYPIELICVKCGKSQETAAQP